jgi:hypothetical protein
MSDFYGLLLVPLALKKTCSIKLFSSLSFLSHFFYTKFLIFLSFFSFLKDKMFVSKLFTEDEEDWFYLNQKIWVNKFLINHVFFKLN